MKLIGNLKKQVEETKNKEEAKEVIEKAGMELTDEELDQVAGGRLSITGHCNCCMYLDTDQCLRCQEAIKLLQQK